MTEYAAYLDDSGHPDDQPFVVVAGFLSTAEKWLEFETDWRATLQKYELGSAFHMADFENARRKDRTTILEQLTRTITNHTEAAFSVVVDIKAYKKVNDVYPLEEGIGTPYALACRGVAKGINNWKRQFFRRVDHLLVFIEKGTKHRGDMEEALRRDGAQVPQPVPKSHPAVQAADILAWEVLRLAKRGDNRRSLKNLLSVRCLEEGIFREKELLHSCREAQLPHRKDIPANVKFVYYSSPNRIRKRTIK